MIAVRIRESVRSADKELANLAQSRTLDSLTAEAATAPVDTSAGEWNPTGAVQEHPGPRGVTGRISSDDCRVPDPAAGLDPVWWTQGQAACAV